jgi:AcrR family transcriptional regulator
MAQVACERGAARATVGDAVAFAGVSRRTFYELFNSAEDCLLAAIDDALASAGARVREACDPAAPWRARVGAGLVAFMRFVEDEPLRARLLLVESLGGGPQVLERRAQALAPAIAAVDAGRDERRRRGEEPSPLVAEAAVGALLAVLHRRLVDGYKRGALLALCPQLMSLLVRPFLGEAAARAELGRPAPAPERASSPADAPLGRLPLRLTARTVGVLAAIAEHPGASNRQIGAHAGVQDQGQMSKLMRRLEGYGLVVNEGGGQVRGAPNAWVLTERGAQIERTVGG